MRRLLQLFTVVLLFSSVDAFAHCKKCMLDLSGCLICADTDFNAYVLCSILNNGNSCYAQGGCEGPAGVECPHIPCADTKWVSVPSEKLKLQRDWQLVSVKVLRVTTAKDGKRRA